jgi:hypothetical protein
LVTGASRSWTRIVPKLLGTGDVGPTARVVPRKLGTQRVMIMKLEEICPQTWFGDADLQIWTRVCHQR